MAIKPCLGGDLPEIVTIGTAELTNEPNCHADAHAVRAREVSPGEPAHACARAVVGPWYATPPRPGLIVLEPYARPPRVVLAKGASVVPETVDMATGHMCVARKSIAYVYRGRGDVLFDLIVLRAAPWLSGCTGSLCPRVALRRSTLHTLLHPRPESLLVAERVPPRRRRATVTWGTLGRPAFLCRKDGF